MKKIALLLSVCVSAAFPSATFAQSRFVVVVNPANPIRRLSTMQLSKIYLGKLQGWDINGKIEPVIALDQKPDSPLRAAFTERVLHRTMTEAESYWRQEIYAGRSFPPAENSEAEALTAVRTMVGGIAYVSANADLKGVKVVSIE
ncbi:MAG: substrate-binding domain-containing protein [Gemmatimonadaceae bacterium]